MPLCKDMGFLWKKQKNIYEEKQKIPDSEFPAFLGKDLVAMKHFEVAYWLLNVCYFLEENGQAQMGNEQNIALMAFSAPTGAVFTL